MSVLLVLVAHNGKTLQLRVSPGTRVDAVQQALVSFTGIPVVDQIVMCHGSRLDPKKALAAYRLPVADVSAAEDNPVYLYNKLHLRPGAELPQVEPEPVLKVDIPPLGPVPVHHPLHTAISPLIRALPDYERQFQQHMMAGRAYWEVSQQRVQRSRQLLSEQEVQARAADAARANVEGHYTYICTVYQEFKDRYMQQFQSHSQLLLNHEALLSQLRSLELPPRLMTAGRRRLADLLPREGDIDRAGDCRRAQEHFASKVRELDNLFHQLSSDVEGLFLQAPTVDLDDLGGMLGQVEQYSEEMGSIIQVLSKDFKTVCTLVEDTVRSMASASITGSMIHDACGAMDNMNDTHVRRLLPRLKECDDLIAAFVGRCAQAKVDMTRDVIEQLQKISSQQSKIRDMKNQLVAFNEVLSRQEEAFSQLKLPHHLLTTYRYCLTECVRRKAWQEVFSKQAMKLADHMAKIREKEMAKREAFHRQATKHLAPELLVGMGLLKDPPHCTVSVPSPDPLLLPVTLADVQRVPVMKGISGKEGQSTDTLTSPSSQDTSSTREEGVGSGEEGPGKGDDAEGHEMGVDLEVENAKLRSELATRIAVACVQELEGSGAALQFKGNSEDRRMHAVPLKWARQTGKEVASTQGTLSASQRTASMPAGTPPQAAQSHEVLDVPTPCLNVTAALEAFRQSLSTKDAYIAKLQAETTSVLGRCSAYERRVSELEALVEKYARVVHQREHVETKGTQVATEGAVEAFDRSTSPALPGSSPGEVPLGPEEPPEPGLWMPRMAAEAASTAQDSMLFAGPQSGPVLAGGAAEEKPFFQYSAHQRLVSALGMTSMGSSYTASRIQQRGACEGREEAQRSTQAGSSGDDGKNPSTSMHGPSSCNESEGYDESLQRGLPQSSSLSGTELDAILPTGVSSGSEAASRPTSGQCGALIIKKVQSSSGKREVWESQTDFMEAVPCLNDRRVLKDSAGMVVGTHGEVGEGHSDHRDVGAVGTALLPSWAGATTGRDEGGSLTSSQHYASVGSDASPPEAVTAIGAATPNDSTPKSSSTERNPLCSNSSAEGGSGSQYGGGSLAELELPEVNEEPDVRASLDGDKEEQELTGGGEAGGTAAALTSPSSKSAYSLLSSSFHYLFGTPMTAPSAPGPGGSSSGEGETQGKLGTSNRRRFSMDSK